MMFKLFRLSEIAVKNHKYITIDDILWLSKLKNVNNITNGKLFLRLINNQLKIKMTNKLNTENILLPTAIQNITKILK